MCGRFALKAPAAELIQHFGLDACADLTPRYNIPPGVEIAAIRQSPTGQRVLHRLRWGLVPNWAKDPSIGNKLNNARGETVADKPSFREAFKRRRCLIPADGFYEWSARGKLKQPWYISLKSGQPLAMAGLWEAWTSPAGDILRTCCVITTGPNEVMQAIHDRMPVLIAAQDWARWLSGPADTASDLIRPYAADAMQAWPVDRRVSKSGEEGAELILPCLVKDRLPGACPTLVVDSENRPQRGHFLPDLPPHGCSMGQEAGEEWSAAADLQPTIPKSDRLLD